MTEEGGVGTADWLGAGGFEGVGEGDQGGGFGSEGAVA